MKAKNKSIIGFFVILILGILLHFTYDWSGENVIVSFFSAVNESPWEHLKLLFWPALFYSIYEYFAYGKERKDFFAIKMTAILSALIFILTFFYTYSGILGFNLFLLDIFDFVMADFIFCYLSYKMYTLSDKGDVSDSVKAVFVLLILAMCFIFWTNNPPDLGVFWG